MTTPQRQREFQTVLDQHKKILYKVCNSYCSRRIDYSRPIAEIQKQIETLRVLRIRITQIALLGGTVVWGPFVIVAARAFLGLDIINALWIWINVTFGLCLIFLALWLSKAFGERMGRFPFIQRVMNDFVGRNLNDAADFLSKLSEFEAAVQRAGSSSSSGSPVI